MNRLILVAAAFAAICNFSVVPAVADGHDVMKLYDSDGKLRWDHSGQNTPVPEQNKEKRMDGTRAGEAVKNGADDRQKKNSSDGQKPISRDRY